MLTLGLVRSFRADRIVQPMIGIAAGVHHLSVHGTAPAPEQASTIPARSRRWRRASAGVALALDAARGGPRRGGRADGLADRRPSASTTPMWQRSIALPCSRMRGCLRPSRHISIAIAWRAVAALACGVRAERSLVAVDPDRAPTAASSTAPRLRATEPARRSGRLLAARRRHRHRSRAIGPGTATTARWSTSIRRRPGARAAPRGGLAVEGDGFVNVDPSPSIDSITDQVTISGWGYLEGTIVDYATIASREIGTTIDQHYHISINHAARCRPSVHQDGGRHRAAAGTDAVTRQTWVHIAGTYDGDDGPPLRRRRSR